MAHTCSACGKNAEPYGDLVPGQGVVQRCGNAECGAPLPRDGVEAAIYPQALSQVPKSAATSAVASHGQRTTSSILTELRARRESVAMELLKMKALGDELALLDLMLAAASSA